MYVSYIFVIQRLTTICNLRVFRLTTVLVAIRICRNEVLWHTADSLTAVLLVSTLQFWKHLFYDTAACFHCI